MDSKQDPSLLRPTPSHTNTIPHDPTENIPDAAYPESDYRPGTGYSSNASQTHLNRPQGSGSPREASSSSSPTHLQPRQWPVGGGSGVGGGGGGGGVGQAGPSNLPLEPPPPYEPSQSSPTTQSPLPSQATGSSYGPPSQQTPSSYGASQQAPSLYTQSHPASSYTTQPYSQPPSSYAPSLARPGQYSQPQQTGSSGNDIPMTNLSTTGVYGQNQNLGMSPQQPPGAGPVVAGTENGGPKYGPAATRRRWGKRRFKICVFIVIAVIVLIIALVVGVALGVLRVQLDE